MSIDHSSWWYGGDSYDRRTNERLDEVAAAQARARSHLADQMRRQTGNLQAQIDRLTEAFVAFVEYEDIRGELNQHVDAAAVRRYAREVVATTVMTGGNGLGSLSAPSDVFGYWLAPAARGIALAAVGSVAESEEALAEAGRRDPTRTAFYLVLLDALRREPRWGVSHLAATLPQDGQVTRGQRAVWIAIADGRLGDGARRDLVAALARLVGSPGADALAPVLQPSVGKALNSTEQAVQRLARLRELVSGAVTSSVEERSDSASTRAPAEEPGDTARAEDPIADCLRALVDQGAPSEAEVLERMASARQRMGFVTPAQAEDRWDAPAGEVLDLLLADLSRPDGGRGLHGVAVDVLAPTLRASADAFEQDAIAAPPPERTISVNREVVTVTERGATDPAWPDRVTAAIRSRNPQPAWRQPAGYAAAGIAVVALVLAIVVAPGFWALAIAAGVAAGVLLAQHLTAARERASMIDHTLQRATRDIDAAARAVVADREGAAAARTAASGHRAAIHAALP